MEKHFNLRIESRSLAKFRYVSGYHGRSANAQLIQLMIRFVANYERDHGPIPEEDLVYYMKSKRKEG